MKKFTCLLFLVTISSCLLQAQDSPFNLDAYKKFLSENEDMSPAELYELYPSGLFAESVSAFTENDVLFFRPIDSVYNLTIDEKSLLMRNGFMASERLGKNTFIDQFWDVYKNDLPVFVSTDAILHAFHISYDEILEELELKFLMGKLTELLKKSHSHIKDLDLKYASQTSMKPMLMDVDIYYTVPLKLLGQEISPFYPENTVVLNELLKLIGEEKWSKYKMFSDSCIRDIDFSQFKPRGHYESWFDDDLAGYFRAMMWLGRIELYLASPTNTVMPPPCDKDTNLLKQTIKRQIIDAALIHEVSSYENIRDTYHEIEEVISFFVGEQDNVSLDDLGELFDEAGMPGADAFLMDENINKFQDILATKSYADQKILSQLLASDYLSSESLMPASAFMLFGQRFVIDSYVTGQVVYDRIIYRNGKPCRLFPSMLDVLFALGHDASTQLLIPELHQYHYADNLAGLRYLIDQYPQEFWESSMYNMWLYAIHSLNPRPQLENIPEFMRTGAWGLEKMNTQLSSLTELRHDNLLYAKQSYTGIAVCSYPVAYVEPIPVFYQRMGRMAELTIERFSTLPGIPGDTNGVIDYFELFNAVCDTLGMIASKELDNKELSDMELQFLNRLCHSMEPCGSGSDVIPHGWYADLYYSIDEDLNQRSRQSDFLVADYHTTPTDCGGNPTGWISHAGTGKVDMLLAVATLPDDQKCAFIGPVMSYHEYRTDGFLRLNDYEWEETYLNKSLRPEWVRCYLADKYGHKNETGLKLFSDPAKLKAAFESGIISSAQKVRVVEESAMSIYPNPMTISTIISLGILEGSRNVHTRLSVYNMQGSLMRILIDEELPPGHFFSGWDRTDESGTLVPAGTYFIKLDQGDRVETSKLIVID